MMTNAISAKNLTNCCGGAEDTPQISKSRRERIVRDPSLI